jgi:hypothetical protein
MKTTECPCCGQPTQAVPIETMVAVVSPLLAEMVQILSKTPGQFVLTDQIASYIWRRDRDGGPENFAVCIASLVARNRQRLRALGWDVEGRLGRLGGYRIIVSHEARE